MQAEQELANPATSLTAVASYEEITRILRKPLVSEKDKVGCIAQVRQECSVTC